jgi:hypothetical protein
MVYRDHTNSMMVATKPKPPSTLFQDTVIVTAMNASNNVSALANSLLKQFAELGSTVKINDIADASSLGGDGGPKCTGKFVVSLLEVEVPLLSDITERDFYNLQQLITQSVGTLWVTCGAPGCGPGNPYLHAVSGFFRVIKSENTQLMLHELHLSRPEESNLESLSDNIIHIFKSIPSEHRIGLETEIVEEDGRFKIPRLMDEKFKNWDLHISGTGTVPQPELQPLLQPERPLALTVGIPGILDSLHFIDDLSLSKPIADNEVEIEVQANASNHM